MILTIHRTAVEAHNLAAPLAQLLALMDSRENVLFYQASLSLRFDGYDLEPRELFEIPELRAFMQALAAEWPHWLWYLKRGDNSLPLLFSFFCEIRVIPGPEGYEAEFADGNEFLGVLNNLLERAQALYQAYDIPEAEAARSVESAIQDIFGK